MPKPFVVEVETRVTPSRLWRALTDTSEVAQWFGWDAETLADEIQFIFVDHSSIDAERMRMDAEGMDQYVEVAPSGANSVVRAVQAGEDPEDGEYDSMKSGWIAFLHQLKRYVEEHTDETRRTIFLKGVGNAGFITSAAQERLPGEVWFSDEHTLVIATPDFGPGLGVLNTTPPLGGDERGESNFTLTTYGLSDREFAHLAEEWLEWWQVIADDSELITGAS
jgi:hypothetical protein